MKHDFQIIAPKNMETIEWASGTSCELFISPKSARFSKKNFDFRLSIATVEDNSSIFTELPKIKRTTLVLEGETTLSHKEQYTKHLKRFDQDTYNGDWATSSEGKSTNFNLMTRGSVQSEVKANSLEKDEQLACPTNGGQASVYVHNGRIAVVMMNDAEVVEAGSLFVLPSTIPLVIVKALEESELIITHISK